MVSKLKLISATFNSLELNNTKSAPHLHQLLLAHDPALQITSKIEANNKAINLISTRALRVYKYVSYNSLAPRRLASDTNGNFNN